VKRNCCLALATLLSLLTGSITACGRGCGGGLAAADICPGPVYGYARVEVTVLRVDGTPAAGRQGFVSCGDVIGAYGAHTNADGRFVVEPVYSNTDTVFSPHPPRGADGGFLVSCAVNAEVRRDVVARDSVVVPFAPTRPGVTSIAIELREPSP
jgi:hypothetical protein